MHSELEIDRIYANLHTPQLVKITVVVRITAFIMDRPVGAI